MSLIFNIIKWPNWCSLHYIKKCTEFTFPGRCFMLSPVTSFSLLTWLYKKECAASDHTIHTTLRKEAVKEVRDRRRSSMMKFVFALVVLWHLCYSAPIDPNLNDEMIDRLEALGDTKVINSSVSIMHRYYNILLYLILNTTFSYVSGFCCQTFHAQLVLMLILIKWILCSSATPGPNKTNAPKCSEYCIFSLSALWFVKTKLSLLWHAFCLTLEPDKSLSFFVL